MKRISVLLLLVSLLGGLLSACRSRLAAQSTATLAPSLPPPPTATRTPLPTPTLPPTPIPSLHAHFGAQPYALRPLRRRGCRG